MTTSPALSITDELLGELDALLGLNANGSLSSPLPYLSRVLLEKSAEHIRSLQAALAQQPVPVAAPEVFVLLTAEQIATHALTAKECAPQSKVLLVSSIKRLHDKNAPAAEQSACKTCGGSGVVDDGEICCSEGGIPYENGPVKCVKDCPACAQQPDTVKVSRELLEELAGDLAAEVEARYPDKDHPALKHKYERDMRPVLEARALLDGGDKP